MSYEQALEKKQKKEPTSPHLKVKLYSQFEVFFDDFAASVSAKNTTGPFDILPGHANFFSLLSKGEVVIGQMDGKNKSIGVDRGVIYVHDDIVKVFMNV